MGGFNRTHKLLRRHDLCVRQPWARREWKMLGGVQRTAAFCGAYDRAAVLPRTAALNRLGGYPSTVSS
jgi:hypothetical protein